MTSTPDRSFVWVDNEAPTSRWPPLRVGEVWKHRELVYFFALRDVKVRYKQAVLGVGWAVIQPLVGALMFTVLFHNLADVDVGTGSYFAFALVGYSAWTYFSTSVTSGANTLLYNSELLTKVAFPRIVAPIATLLPGLIDFAVGATVALGVAIAGGDLNVVQLPLLIPGVILLVVAAIGPVLALSAAVVRYRDLSVVVSFVIQLLLFASPVAYPPDLVSGGWRTVLYLNPLSGSLGLLRAALIGSDTPSAGHLAVSAAVAAMFLVAGLAHFRGHEREFADII